MTSKKTSKKTPAKAATTSPEGNGEPSKAKKEKTQKEPRPELVVFALRMTAEERAALHKAAGPAKATKFARALLTAASRGDAKAVGDIVAAVQQ